MSASTRPLLVMAHPGHELRVHHWLFEQQPCVLVLTDGSGQGAQGRIATTTQILAAAEAPCGALYGRYSDASLYHGILTQDPSLLRGIVDAIVAAALTHASSLIAGDAMEGFNPGHDLCRYAINAAIKLLEQRHDRRVANYAFALDGPPLDAQALPATAIHHILESAALTRKLGDVARYKEIRADAERLLARYGAALFASETLLPADPYQGLHGLTDEPPYYERVGEQRRTAGVYRDVIRYREHMLPLARGLWAELGLALPNAG